MRYTGVLGALLVLMAPVTVAAEPVGKDGVTVEKWAAGLSAPQGIATDGRGRVYVAENGTGKVFSFTRDGKGKALLAEGLMAPAFALFHDEFLYVAERNGNSIARIAPEGRLTRLTGDVVDPLGLAPDPKRRDSFLVVSHRQSVVRRFAPDRATRDYALQPGAVVSVPAGTQYGWRDLAVAEDGTVYVTDELKSVVLRRKLGGAIEPWVTGLSSPSGLAVTARGEVYLTEEGNGRLSRITPDGKAVVLAEGMGKAREALLLDDRTILVTDRAGGDIWKVTLPR